MDCDEDDNSGVSADPRDGESRSAVNSLILDYYKKFGKKRDLEQYFSLSTAQSDIRDPSSSFWSRMKNETESSDSGERSDKKSESSQELCRISIRFPAPDTCNIKENDSKSKTESVSPPIIVEEVSPDSRKSSDDEAMKSDDNNSQKSYDVLLDTSINKPHSPSSSITSQRKLEWDSLADVGYANESDRKNSGSSLSTLERLALKQQYSNNDTQQSNLGAPTAQSTPLDDTEPKFKSKKGLGKKTTKIYKKDIDFLELNVPHSSHMNPPHSINVNLTKHISFNVEKDGKVTVENLQKDVNVSPEKISIETTASPRVGMDKEIQTSLTKPKKSIISDNVQVESQPQRIPILISLNTLKSRARRKKLRMARRKIKSKKLIDKEKFSVQEKTGEQLSEAESFEYMPGHIYNQSQLTANESQVNTADNKSSLESSGVITTDSSKGSKHSFAKDLEKGIDLLEAALQRGDDSNLKKQLIKQVCHRLLKSRYRDDDSTTNFLSRFSFSSKKLGLSERNNTTTSTSDASNSVESSMRPKKSILRTDKFNPGSIASTSQSVPNLPVASNSQKHVTSKLSKKYITSNTESDMSSKEKTSSDNVFAKTSSEELYQKYLQAKKREETYKRHLIDKEIFLKQKLVSSDSAFKIPVRVEVKQSNSSNNRLKDLIHDLTRNNYDDGSGDASKLEGGPGSSRDFERYLPSKNQRSHSVFTLSSGNSDSKKPNLKKKLQHDIKDLSKPGPSKDSHYCCCPHHSGNIKVGGTDNSIQDNNNRLYGDGTCSAQPNKPIHSRQKLQAESSSNSARVICDDITGDIKYVCLCSNKVVQDVPDSFLIYKCSRLSNRETQLEEASNDVFIPCNNQTCDKRKLENFQSTCVGINNKSSQTNMFLKVLSDDQCKHFDGDNHTQKVNEIVNVADAAFSQKLNSVYEATRCIQTEISINPKISEPTLSDINIVSDTDCAKLISEQFRELKTPSVTEVFNFRSGKNNTESVNGPVSSTKSSGTSKNADIELEDYNFTELGKVEKENIENQKINVDHSEKFTIPIHGTNMTLMVSIGSERKVSVTKKPEKTVSQGMGTDKVSVLEQATCLTEECTKGMQSDNFTYNSDLTDHNSNKIRNGCQNESKLTDTTKTPWTINTCLITEESKFGTYPKKSPFNEEKPFRRSNSDTERIGHVQTELLKNTETQESIKMDIQTGIICSCGCNGAKDKCKISCKERSFSPKYNSNLAFDTLLCEQRNIPNENSKMCSCGCRGLVDNCKEGCSERKLSLTETLKKPQGIETCTQLDDIECSHCDITTNNYGDKCPCRCGGTKENCNECKGPKFTPAGQCIKLAKIDKQISTEKLFDDEQSQKCACGCGGSISKCKKKCKELKSTPREHNNSKLPEKEIPEGVNQKCPCGCGSTKNSCKGDCKKLASPKGKQTIKQILTEKDIAHEENKEYPQSHDYKTPREKQAMPKEHSRKETNEEVSIEKQFADYQSQTKIANQRKLSPREVCRTQSDKQISTEYDFTDERIQSCPCGCGNLKDNCKGDCSESTIKSKASYRHEYLDKKEVGTQKNIEDKQSPRNFGEFRRFEEPKTTLCSNDDKNIFENQVKNVDSCGEQTNIRSSGISKKSSSESQPTDLGPDPILDMIQNITKKYSKKEIEKSKRNKCFKEIMTVLNYLLETDESTDQNENRLHMCESTSTADETGNNIKNVTENPCSSSSSKKISEKNRHVDQVSKKYVDKGVQPCSIKSKPRSCTTESSEMPTSTDIPGTSSDSATCKVLNKIKKECERYHQKRCKIHGTKKGDGTSSTSVNCDQCRRIHHCSCRNHKCKGHKNCEKTQKSPVAYNLILQTSGSVVSEEPVRDKNRPLKNIIVKVPKKKPNICIPFKEMTAKFEKNMNCAIPCATPKDTRSCRSRSLPNESEISSMDEIIRRSQGATVREYLEKNRPDFIEKCSQRQSCLKYISETRANDRAVQRDMLSLHVAQLPDATDLDKDELRRLAKDLGRHMRQKQPAPKFISEREMKKHSEKIYKSLPEVVQKKEDIKKENYKKTNLLMATIFKKNLQKKTLRGSVNLSNYSTVIKI